MPKLVVVRSLHPIFSASFVLSSNNHVGVKKQLLNWLSRNTVYTKMSPLGH